MTLMDDTNRILKAKYESEKLKKDDLKKRLQLIQKRIQNTQNMIADSNASTELSARLEDQQAVFSMLRDFRKEEIPRTGVS